MGKIIMYERIYADLLEKIRTDVFAPGERIPSEKELAEQYGVSRITSKKALDMLAENKYIVRSRGRGSFVNEDAKTFLGQELILKKETAREPLVGVIFDTFASDYGSELLRSVESECRRKGYNMLFKCSYGNIEEENKAIRSALQLGAEGLILICAQGEVYNRVILQLALDKFPMVLVDRQMKGIPIPCVKTDNYSAAKALTRGLIARGHKKICFVSHSFGNTSTIQERYNGFADCVLEYGDVSGNVGKINCYNPAPEKMTKEYINFDFSEIIEVIRKNEDCTAFFVVEFKLGMLFRKVLKEMGLEREIAWFDGLPEVYVEDCKFMHVKQNEVLMGVQAVQTLCDVMQEKKVDDIINIPYEIVVPNEEKNAEGLTEDD